MTSRANEEQSIRSAQALAHHGHPNSQATDRQWLLVITNNNQSEVHKHRHITVSPIVEQQADNEYL